MPLTDVKNPSPNIIRTFSYYDKLIDYTNDKGQVQWIYVSFKREGKNRNEWLHKKA